MRRDLGAAIVAVMFLVGTSGAGARPNTGQLDVERGEQSALRVSASRPKFVFPLKVSRNGRYLVDQRNAPFLIVGDSPQAMIGNLDPHDAATYIANRRAAGFNSLMVDLLCATYTGCRADGSTIDGIKPFTTQGDLATANPAYFDRAEGFLQLAARAGLVVFLDPIETGGWLTTLKQNGVEKDFAFGKFLGRRYAKLANIVWLNGNDFQTWSDASDDAVVLAVARGIASVDHTHIQTIELSYMNSASLDDRRWKRLIRLDAAYTYYPTYAEVLKEYNRKPIMPVFLVEAGYEFEENNSSISPGTPEIIRRQAYWSILAGATGQFYGNHYTWQFADGWQTHLDTVGSAQIGYLARLFEGRPWFKLVPDQAHRVVTDGYGTFTATGMVGASDFVTTAWNPDGTLAISYLPTGNAITVDMARFSGAVRAQWFDPTNGSYTPVPSSPFPNSDTATLTPPGPNAEGNRDWVLVLTAR